MTYVIAEPCVDVKDRSCIEQCPVDCIYEGGRALYINPDECIECGACEPACPMDAVFYDADLPPELESAQQSNLDFFRELLPGRDAPLGNPGGSRRVGPLTVDTPLVSSLPAKNS
ncbi:ferredoxin [Streptomyces sp. NPDC001978]|uniref:ferredoxin n=1 Tax=Streptomyces sp. NPDC001978 TaxID=3364627 RepID=UPI0036857680